MRARNIKPGFYKNEDLAECSFPARLLFPALWMMADRAGRLEDRPKRIKGEIFPFDSIDVEPLIQELEQHELIKRYEAGGMRLIWIPKFLEHQVPHHREAPSTLPPYPSDPVQAQGKPRASLGQDMGQPESSPGQAQGQPPLNPSSLNPESGILNPESSPIGEKGTALFEVCSSTSVADADQQGPPQEEPEKEDGEAEEGGEDGAKQDNCPHREIIAAYHRVLPEFPRVQSWNETSRSNLRQRWREDRARQKIEWWEQFFERVKASAFLSGKKTDFRASLVWLIGPKNFAKVINGQYDDHGPQLGSRLANSNARVAQAFITGAAHG